MLQACSQIHQFFVFNYIVEFAFISNVLKC